MANTRNFREEIELALAGERPDRVPFTFYDGLWPAEVDIAPLQAKGLGICARRGVHRAIRPNVTVKTVTEPDNSLRTMYETPRGTLTALHRRGGYGVMAPVEHPVKTRDDYAILEFIIDDTHYEPDYDYFLAEKERIGDSGATIGSTGYSPLLEIQVTWVGQERFCYEINDNEDALMAAYDRLARKQREMYEVVARGPAEHVLYCGNLVPEMIGLELVRDYVFPCYNAFADLLHEHGRKMGVHLDANNNLIMELVRDASFDLVEAFTPPPTCNVSVAAARSSWPGKCLWINFPSSLHIAPSDQIRAAAREIVEEAGDRKGFLIGVTEDVPTEHVERSVSAILDALSDYGP